MKLKDKKLLITQLLSHKWLSHKQIEKNINSHIFYKINDYIDATELKPKIQMKYNNFFHKAQMMFAIIKETNKQKD